MAKSSVMLAAVMMGAVAIVSPAQAVILSQESTQQVQEERASTLIADRGRWRPNRRYCWRRYGRVRCRYNRDYDRWRQQRWRDRRKWRRERDRYWRDRRRWENRRRRKDNDWHHRDRDYETWRRRESWRRRSRREDFQDKLDRWLNNGRNGDDDD